MTIELRLIRNPYQDTEARARKPLETNAVPCSASKRTDQKISQLSKNVFTDRPARPQIDVLCPASKRSDKKTPQQLTKMPGHPAWLQANGYQFLTWRKIAIFAVPIIIALGSAFLLYHKIPGNPVLPCIDPTKQDPDLIDPKYCATLQESWDRFKSAVVPCHQNPPQDLICFDEIRPAINKFASHCNIDATFIEQEVESNAQHARPLSPDKQFTSEEKQYIYKNIFNDLLRFLHNPNCYVKNCCDLDKNQLHPNEQQAIDAVNSNRWISPSFKESQEYLRLRADDPRDKVLFLSTNETKTRRAKDPQVHSNNLQTFNQQFDLKFKALRGYQDICHEINSASNIGKIRDIYIQGNSGFMLLDAENHGQKVPDKNKPFSECYSDVYSSEKVNPTWIK